MTDALFRNDPYLKTCEASVVAINERGGVVLDKTVFYATGGGQPGDRGSLKFVDGRHFEIATTVYDNDKTTIVHVPGEGAQLPKPGELVTCSLDWEQRLAHMRTHTCLHLLCSLIDAPVTGGQISAGRGRLDFDIPEAVLDKEALTAALNQLIDDDRSVTARWITDAELAAQPELVRTMAVKPPMGSGQVRLIEIADCDLQPCGGTHVARTGEIGRATVTKIEKKGARNRRVRVEID
ncbi:MAG: alanyl-tRNA editing protein [Hyphomicrobiaceae bacterium]